MSHLIINAKLVWARDRPTPSAYSILKPNCGISSRKVTHFLYIHQSNSFLLLIWQILLQFNILGFMKQHTHNISTTMEKLQMIQWFLSVFVCTVMFYNNYTDSYSGHEFFVYLLNIIKLNNENKPNSSHCTKLTFLIKNYSHEVIK